MPAKSTLTRYLVGKSLPGSNKVVETINKSGDGRSRIVHFKDGTKVRVPKQSLVNSFHKILGEQQKASAVRSIRVKPGGKVAVTIGGSVRGERKTYGSVAAAKAAITRHYGK